MRVRVEESVKAKATRSLKVYVGDSVTLKNGRKGEVIDVNGRQFCIAYEHEGGTEWLSMNTIASVS